MKKTNMEIKVDWKHPLMKFMNKILGEHIMFNGYTYYSNHDYVKRVKGLYSEIIKREVEIKEQERQRTLEEVGSIIKKAVRDNKKESVFIVSQIIREISKLSKGGV